MINTGRVVRQCWCSWNSMHPTNKNYLFVVDCVYLWILFSSRANNLLSFEKRNGEIRTNASWTISKEVVTWKVWLGVQTAIRETKEKTETKGEKAVVHTAITLFSMLWRQNSVWRYDLHDVIIVKMDDVTGEMVWLMNSEGHCVCALTCLPLVSSNLQQW